MPADDQPDTRTSILAAPWQRRVGWGASWGMGLGALLSGWAVLVFATGDPRAFLERGLTLPTVVVLYAFGGLVGGAVVGAALPLVRRPLGAAIVGGLAVAPLGAALAIALGGPAWTSKHSIVVTGLAVLVGAPVGLIYAQIWASDIRRAEGIRRAIRKP